MPAVQSMLSALAGTERVTIGREPPEALRRLSDARRLTCPLCRAPVVLKAGAVLAPHFAHLPGASCAHPHAEPETDAHRAGKALLAQWLADRLPDARVTLEATLPQTGQRADVLVETADGRRVALEYQCADLSAREWRRRHGLYRQAGVRDLWLLGANRLACADGVLLPGELERAMLWDGAPLLFLDPLGERAVAGTVTRFRPAPERAARVIQGWFSARAVADLAFPWKLLDWPRALNPPEPDAPVRRPTPGRGINAPLPVDAEAEEARLWRWLRLRHGVTPEVLPPFFGLPVAGAEAFGCALRLWQACTYFRWIHGRIGDAWWIEEVNVWARRYLPLAIPTGRQAWRALTEFQMLLAAAGMLTVPYGKGCARVQADLDTLPTPPDPQAVLRVAAYRRTLPRERGVLY